MSTKRVFIAFAMEDRSSRDLFSGQKVNSRTPVNFVDMSVKQPYLSSWKTQTRTRIRSSDGVIALVSASTSGAEGQLWEISCAIEEGKPLLGVWLGDYRAKPSVLGTAPCKTWTWANIAAFVDGL